jgi:hypothetical protein
MADTAYGLWPLVILNTALFAIFAVSLFHPRTGRDWRAMGGFTYAAVTPGFVPRHRPIPPVSPLPTAKRGHRA